MLNQADLWPSTIYFRNHISTLHILMNVIPEIQNMKRESLSVSICPSFDLIWLYLTPVLRQSWKVRGCVWSSSEVFPLSTSSMKRIWATRALADKNTLLISFFLLDYKCRHFEKLFRTVISRLIEWNRDFQKMFQAKLGKNWVFRFGRKWGHMK